MKRISTECKNFYTFIKKVVENKDDRTWQKFVSGHNNRTCRKLGLNYM